MRSKAFPIAVIAVLLLVACGGGGGEQTQQPRGRTGGTASGGTAAPAATGGYSVAAVASGGTISGKVSFEGTPPAARIEEITKDTPICGEEKTFQIVSVADGGLADTVVWIDGITSGKDWGSLNGGAIDQKKCNYHPHIQVMKSGDELQITNSDSTLHNIHAYQNDKETLFNFAQPTAGMTTPQALTKTGPVHLKCDVHSWMSSWVFVAGHPYYTVTAADGSFTLPDVPAGTYTVKAWHESYGEKMASVTVTAGGDAMAAFTMP